MTDKQYMARVADLGCVLCRYLKLGATPPHLHHPKVNGVRGTDREVIGLCPFHHTGAGGIHGLGRKAFERCYGLTERDLLAMVRQQLAP